MKANEIASDPNENREKNQCPSKVKKLFFGMFFQGHMEWQFFMKLVDSA